MALTTSLTAALVFTYLLSYFVYHYIIHPLFLSPLANLPSAHPTCPVLPTWIWWKRRTGQESRPLSTAHQKYGPVVRVAPNEVSIVSLGGLKTVYVGGFDRTDWFLQFRSFDGRPNLLTMLGSKEHSVQRRMLSNVYSKSYILGSPDFHAMSRVILSDHLFPVLELAAGNGVAVDVFELGSALGMEFMTAYEVGIGRCYDFVGGDKEFERRRRIEDGIKRVMGLKGHKESGKRMEAELLDMCRKAEAFLTKDFSESVGEAEVGREESTYPVVFAQLRNAILHKRQDLDTEELLRLVACELFDHLEAAMGSFAITLTYAIHHLSQRPDVLSTLQNELAALDPSMILPFSKDTLSTTSLRKLDSLEMLDSVVLETLRLHPAAPGPQRRVVPKGGTVIEGYFIPAGVTIFSSAYCMHRQESVYPDPESWKPERWVKNDLGERDADNDDELEKGAPDDDPRRWFWAFSSGGKMCIGNHFSTIVVKLLLASIYRNFTTTIIDDEGIEQRDEFLGFPRSLKLMIGFDRVRTE